jgi:hypothetical protein
LWSVGLVCSCLALTLWGVEGHVGCGFQFSVSTKIPRLPGLSASYKHLGDPRPRLREIPSVGIWWGDKEEPPLSIPFPSSLRREGNYSAQ